MTHFDVVICGGGLAGLTLARQLRLRMPDLSIAILDQATRPLPEAAHKVGESSVEVGSHYLGETLQLQSYLEESHLPKLGLRFFFGDSSGSIESRPELGPGVFPPTTSYQMDRGRLENDLRGLVDDAGVTILEGQCVRSIDLSDGNAPHSVTARDRAGNERLFSARWVVDATGRRRQIQRQLDLGRPSGHKASAAWWRVKGRADVAAMVNGEPRDWNRRVVEERYLSTNHFMGNGYWVWLIPLSSGHTSVGIVVDETIHPFQTFGKSSEAAIVWLEQHEPEVARLLAGFRVDRFSRLS